ncbi:MAG TPA: winged helix DNA-binding domain-containing protein [Acidimicrobiales bacterium]
MPVPEMTWTDVTARRMARHHLDRPADGRTLAEVTATLTAVHAQVMSAAELSLGRRVAGATRADVRRALGEDRTLVKTFGPRGTVHLLATDDLPLWTGACAALPPSVPRQPDGIRFTPDEAEQVLAAIGEALADAELTVDELTTVLADRLGPWVVEPGLPAFQGDWPRWRQLTGLAGQRGVLCFGAERGRKVTYTNPHRWRPGFRPGDGATAVRELVARYLHAYGPATPDDLARWLGVPPRATGDLFGRLAAEGAVTPVRVEGAEAWVAAGDEDAPDAPHRGVRLLPYFDVYVVGGRPRDRLFPGAAAARALTRTGQAGNHPVLLVDGVVAGVWHQKRAGRKVAITVEPLGDLTAAQRRGLDAEVELVGAVVEATPTLTIGPVTVGPHA